MWSHDGRALEREGPKLAATSCPTFLPRWGPRLTPEPGIRRGGLGVRSRLHPTWNPERLGFGQSQGLGASCAQEPHTVQD